MVPASPQPWSVSGCVRQACASNGRRDISSRSSSGGVYSLLITSSGWRCSRTADPPPPRAKPWIRIAGVGYATLLVVVGLKLSRWGQSDLEPFSLWPLERYSSLANPLGQPGQDPRVATLAAVTEQTQPWEPILVFPLDAQYYAVRGGWDQADGFPVQHLRRRVSIRRVLGPTSPAIRSGCRWSSSR